MSLIQCSCGECKLTTTDDYPIMSLFCACKDCRQAIKWGELRGGKTIQKLPQLIYVRSDIISVVGEKSMKPYQLRKSAKSTRVYCNKCFSILGIDHPTYADNVFMFFPYHCKTDMNLSIAPCATLNISSYLHSEPADIPTNMPIFYNFDYVQESKRFLSLPEVQEVFRDPVKNVVGKTFSTIIKNLGDIKILNLEVGAEPL